MYVSCCAYVPSQRDCTYALTADRPPRLTSNVAAAISVRIAGAMALVSIKPTLESGAIHPEMHAYLNGPIIKNELGVEFQRINIAPSLDFTLKILDGLTWPSLPASCTGIPKIAREPAFWVHVFLFITCEYGVSLLVNGGKPWWLEKVLVSLVWGAVLACLPSAAAHTIRRIWATRLWILRPVVPADQPGAANVPFWVGQLCTGCCEAAPDGWLPCHGQPVSRQDYNQLFRVIKSAYGDGDGQTTFNVPDLRGRLAVGKGSEGSGFETIGSTGGEVTHKLEEHEMPSHHHGVQDPGHTHNVLACGRGYTVNGGGGFGVNALGRTGEGSGAGDTQVSHSNISLHSAGGGAAHNNMPPYIVMCYFIKC